MRPAADQPTALDPDQRDTPLHLRAGGVSLVLDLAGADLPRVLHWGQDLGDLSSADLTALRPAFARAASPRAHMSVPPPDAVPTVPTVPTVPAPDAVPTVPTVSTVPTDPT
ncbi:MAG: hypothetical protein LBD97_02595, partial [Bifidobacteriaceae bacterium]|nr:hypothetical protein [Bifidobacteriaceae bacterium]